jgi:hypothetical protein
MEGGVWRPVAVQEKKENVRFACRYYPDEYYHFLSLICANYFAYLLDFVLSS